MKKIILLSLGLMWMTLPAMAAHSKKAPAETNPLTQESPWYVGMGMGLDIPESNWNQDFYLGGVGSLFAGYQLDKTLSVQAQVDHCLFSGGGLSIYNPRFLAEAKYTFQGKGWQPYLLAGGGLDLQYASPSGASTSNLDALAGAGVQVDLSGKTHAFLEARYNFTLTQTQTLQDVPVAAGIWVGL